MEPVKIFQLLKEKIIKLELLPGSVLNLSELAQSFNVSRTPVKEATIMLHTEGWILREGGRFTVTPLSLKLIKEITEIRSNIEIQANLWAMQRIDNEEIMALDEWRQKVLGLEDGLSNKEMIELDIQFHRILFFATKNIQLAMMLERLLGHYLRFWLSIPRKIEPAAFFSATLEIIRAIEDKDEALVLSLSEAHIKESIDTIMSSF
ncbi:MAG: GntR family transcriptional regulator [Deltaproteobacteria bacterium]|nr:GntR family transcriptional regulator [Deltaproteobacteria bacterium]